MTGTASTIDLQRRRPRVLLITEGTYPYHFGGVSTWCHGLVHGVPQVDFTLMSLIADPRLEPVYDLPPTVELRPVPLWGVLDSREAAREFTLRHVERRRRTSDAVAARELVPILGAFVTELWTGAVGNWQLSVLIHQIYRFALEYDLDAALRSRAVWDCFGNVATNQFPRAAAARGYSDATFVLADLATGMRWLRHLLFPLAQMLPRADVAHAAMAGTCSLIAIAAKLEHGAAFLLTEHGIFLREAYLAASVSADSLFVKLLRLRFARRITELSYAVADQISPCCEYNKRWELRLGADPNRLRTLHYGVDSTEFKPADMEPRVANPVVAWVGRINPLKDLRTLIEAAALVKAQRPDVRFLLFGSATAEDAEYYDDLVRLREHLGLEDVVQFAGYSSHPATAYHQADLVVLSSLSEAFPFSILEAMLCGKPVVATAVGGVPEEVEACGVLVEPRRPAALAEGILALVNDPARRAAMGQAARQRALEHFTLDESNAAHYLSYLRLAYLSSGAKADEASSVSQVSPGHERPGLIVRERPEASGTPVPQPSPAG